MVEQPASFKKRNIWIKSEKKIKNKETCILRFIKKTNLKKLTIAFQNILFFEMKL